MTIDHAAEALEAADILREVKAAAWEEGYRSGYIEGQADAHRLDPDDIEETPNPYADSPRHNAPQRREEQAEARLAAVIEYAEGVVDRYTVPGRTALSLTPAPETARAILRIARGEVRDES